MQLYLEAGERAGRGHIPGLDGIRAISIFLVMLSHSGLQNIVPGVFGVTIFFFISGFLITTLLIQEFEANDHINIIAFYVRRIVRLYPPLLMYLGTIVGVLLIQGMRIDLIGLLGALFYFGNYLFALAAMHIDPYGAHLWSLAVEEHFYLFFPLICFAFMRWPARLLSGLIFLCAIALAIRVYYFNHLMPTNETYILVATEARFDSILFGCITGLMMAQPFASRMTRVLTHPLIVIAAISIIVFSLVYREPMFRQTWRFTVQGLALMPLILAAIYTPRYLTAKRVLNSWLFRWTGALSYSLYLWHFLMFELAKTMLGGLPAVVIYAAGWLLAFIIAALIYRMVEQPMLQLRRRFGSHARSVSAGQLS